MIINAAAGKLETSRSHDKNSSTFHPLISGWATSEDHNQCSHLKTHLASSGFLPEERDWWARGSNKGLIQQQVFPFIFYIVVYVSDPALAGSLPPLTFRKYGLIISSPLQATVPLKGQKRLKQSAADWSKERKVLLRACPSLLLPNFYWLVALYGPYVCELSLFRGFKSKNWKTFLHFGRKHMRKDRNVAWHLFLSQLANHLSIPRIYVVAPDLQVRSRCPGNPFQTCKKKKTTTTTRECQFAENRQIMCRLQLAFPTWNVSCTERSSVILWNLQQPHGIQRSLTVSAQITRVLQLPRHWR